MIIITHCIDEDASFEMENETFMNTKWDYYRERINIVI